MPEFSIDTPSPDRGHEAIRLAVLQAIADQQQNAADNADGFYLDDMLLGLVDGLLAQVDVLLAQVEALTARVTALEPTAAAPREE